MPINAGYAYQVAEDKYYKANTDIEKLAALEEMLATIPKHKGTEVQQMGIKKKISKLKELMKSRKGAKGSGGGMRVIKEAEVMVGIIGETNSGKSKLLTDLTKAKPDIANYEFTTTMPVSGIMDYEGAKIQLVEIPSFFDPQSKGIMRLMEVLVVLIDLTKDPKEQEKMILEHLEGSNINKPLLFVNTKVGIKKFEGFSEVGTDDLKKVKKRIFELTGKIRVFSKRPGGPIDKETAILVNPGATIIDVCNRIHKSMAKSFKYAKIWGKGKYKGQQVSAKFKVSDKDIVEIHY